MLFTLLWGGLIGVVFGIAFEKSKVLDASAIVGQLLFRRFIMLKVFLTAVITSMIVLNLMNHFGIFVFSLKEFNVMTNILGGGLLGIGIALTGSCPGTVFAQMGVGYKDAFFVFAGGFVMAYAYNFFGQAFEGIFSPWFLGHFRLNEVIGMAPFLVITGIIVGLIIFLVIIEKLFPWRRELDVMLKNH